ncbi:cyclic nucleotide-binding domain-containing protein [Caenimonas koreensis]|uniref:Mechanosensitive ion channel n=1 Tax=Caenimonas koreensis DSM 17982 TaxID=1121255 RepID=A0A844B7V9_9BURK|nr:mechanosensitive ion channel family protein [Caenimonas koreensis]MRD49243.1 mechanosensitive ion channel [Caenimonas koreensis DSM 17982]
MNDLLTAAISRRQELLWAWLSVAAVALAFRLARKPERRSLQLAWALLLLAIVADGFALVINGPAELMAAAVAASVVLGGIATIQVVAAWLFRGIAPTLGLKAPRIAEDLTVTALSMAGLLLWLRLAGVDPSQVFATSALITAVLAISMQDTLGNVLGGVALQLDNSLRVGDWVRADDVNGMVVDVRWRYTAVQTRNRETVIVPNSWLMKNRFVVLRPPADGPLAWRRAVTLNVAIDAAPHAVIDALERSVADAEIDHVLKSPAPSALLTDIGPGYCKYTLRYWMSEPQHDDPGDSAVRIHALAALARAGLRLGVPLQEELSVKENEGWRRAAQERELAQKLAALRGAALFAQLPASEQEALAGHLVHAPFAAGDVMTRQGAIAHWLYLVIRGEAKVTVEGPQGPVQVAMLRDGDFFGEMGMLTGAPRGATVTAVTAVESYRLDKDGFAQVLQARREIAQEISAIVQARNEQLQARLAQDGAGTATSDDILSRIRKFFSLEG